jgi:glycosyltransferase involved in cell wall biosynthesis
VDGNYAYVSQVTRRQADRGHAIAVAYHGRDDLNESNRDARIDYRALPALYPGPAWAVESLATWRTLEQQIRAFKPDVIHGSLRVGTFDMRLPSLCARWDIPLVLTFHVSFARSINPATAASAAGYAFYSRVLNAAAAVVAMGPQQRQWLTKLAHVEESRIYEIAHGVNYVQYCPGPSMWRQNLSEELVVGYVGRIAPEKNLEALCEGFLDAQLPSARLVLVGQGPSWDKLHQQFGDHPAIDLVGAINDRSELADVMRGLDVFVLPSLIEGFSLSLLEAMASGVVSVVTDVGEHHRLVEGCGVLVHPSRAAPEISRALVELAAHPDRRRTLAAASRLRASRLSWDRTAAEILSVYRRVV